MSDSEVTFDAAAVSKSLKDILDRYKKIEKRDDQFARLISIPVYRNILDHFSKETGPKGKWTTWSKLYAERMAKQGKGGNKILQDTRNLVQNVRPENYRKVSGAFEFYNNARNKDGEPYAYWHNEGLNGMPERRFMWLSKNVEKRLAVITLRYLAEGKGS